MDNTMVCNIQTTPLTVVSTCDIGNYSLQDTVNEISKRLNIIESILHIPIRDKKYEEKYEKLDQLWKEYEETLHALRCWSTIEESK